MAPPPPPAAAPPRKPRSNATALMLIVSSLWCCVCAGLYLNSLAPLDEPQRATLPHAEDLFGMQATEALRHHAMATFALKSDNRTVLSAFVTETGSLHLLEWVADTPGARLAASFDTDTFFEVPADSAPTAAAAVVSQSPERASVVVGHSNGRVRVFALDPRADERNDRIDLKFTLPVSTSSVSAVLMPLPHLVLVADEDHGVFCVHFNGDILRECGRLPAQDVVVDMAPWGDGFAVVDDGGGLGVINAKVQELEYVLCERRVSGSDGDDEKPRFEPVELPPLRAVARDQAYHNLLFALSDEGLLYSLKRTEERPCSLLGEPVDARVGSGHVEMAAAPGYLHLLTPERLVVVNVTRADMFPPQVLFRKAHPLGAGGVGLPTIGAAPSGRFVVATAATGLVSLFRSDLPFQSDSTGQMLRLAMGFGTALILLVFVCTGGQGGQGGGGGGGGGAADDGKTAEEREEDEMVRRAKIALAKKRRARQRARAANLQ